MKKNIIFAGTVLLIFFALPKTITTVHTGTFSDVGDNLQLWKVQRAAMVFACITYLLFSLSQLRLSKAAAVWISAATALATLQAGTESFAASIYAIVGAATAYHYSKNIPGAEDGERLSRFAVAMALFYISQYLVFRIGSRVTASFLDPNISGYYLYLCYLLFRYRKHRALAFLAAFAGAYSLSRNFVLAVLIFEISRFALITFQRIKPSRPLFLRAELLTIASLIVVAAGSLAVTKSSQITETIGDSSRRFTNIMDNSNYQRALANVQTIERVVIKHELVLSGNGSSNDGVTAVRPHNAFLRAVYRYGFALSILLFLAFFFVLNKLGRTSLPAILGLFSYYSILNDFITGIDLVLLAIILSILARSSPLRKSENKSATTTYRLTGL